MVLPVGCIRSIQIIGGIPQRLLLAPCLYLVVKKASYRWLAIIASWSYLLQQSKPQVRMKRIHCPNMAKKLFLRPSSTYQWRQTHQQVLQSSVILGSSVIDWQLLLCMRRHNSYARCHTISTPGMLSYHGHTMAGHTPNLPSLSGHGLGMAGP